MAEAQFWTVNQVAETVQVDPRTVRRWIKDGQLKAVKVGPGLKGAVRISQAEVDRLVGVRGQA